MIFRKKLRNSRNSLKIKENSNSSRWYILTNCKNLGYIVRKRKDLSNNEGLVSESSKYGRENIVRYVENKNAFSALKINGKKTYWQTWIEENPDN